MEIMKYILIYYSVQLE